MEEKIALDREPEKLFLSHAIMELKRGLTTYVYREHILNKLKERFSDLEIARKEFYWVVKNKEVSK